LVEISYFPDFLGFRGDLVENLFNYGQNYNIFSHIHDRDRLKTGFCAKGNIESRFRRKFQGCEE